jgi:hypothetical protein
MGITRWVVAIIVKALGGRDVWRLLEAQDCHADAKSNATKPVDLKPDAGITAALRAVVNKQKRGDALLVLQRRVV